MTDAAQAELLCSNCGGQRSYDPALPGLRCAQCDETYLLDDAPDADAAAERGYEKGGELEVRLDAHTHHCETCGGEVVFTGPVLSERCAYCDGPVVLRPSAFGYEAMALIPFQVTEEEALEKARHWIGRRLAAPNDLSTKVEAGRMAGLYAPFWTFDSEEAVAYWASYRVRRGKKTVTRSVRGHMRTSFDDLLVPASHHVTPLIRDGIIHDFVPERLRAYRPAYLAGFGAERHHQTVSEGLAAARKDKDLLIRNRIKTHVGKSGTRVKSYTTDTTDIRYRRILLPVWILHYVYDDKPLKVVVCGIEGRAFGERPFSISKLFAYAAGLTAATMVIGVLWGVGAAP